MYLYNIHRNPIELDRSSKKFICPSCGKRRFVRYFNSETNDYLPDYLGRCDRDEGCGYFEKPVYESTKNKRYPSLKKNTKPTTSHATKPTKPIDKAKFIQSVQAYQQNSFYRFLKDQFGEATAVKLVERYFIGSGRKGSTVFWYLDKGKQIRTGKIMHYLPDGHRNKAINQNWVHKKLAGQSQPITTLFGEHLLHEAKDSTVAIVESEKTAIVCSIFFPEYIWLASGGLTFLNASKCLRLKGYKLVLFPDHSEPARSKWQQVARELRKAGVQARMSDYLSELNDGSDLADVLLKKVVKPTTSHATKPTKPLTGHIETLTSIKGEVYELEINEHGYPAMWDN